LNEGDDLDKLPLEPVFPVEETKEHTDIVNFDEMHKEEVTSDLDEPQTGEAIDSTDHLVVQNPLVEASLEEILQKTINLLSGEVTPLEEYMKACRLGDGGDDSDELPEVQEIP
jgi:hypothetical protein